MKMGFMFSQVFWGLLLIVLGLSIILKVIFNLNIPVFRMVISFLLIYMGLQILFGGFPFEKNDRNVIFNDNRIKVTAAGDYNIIFGKGIVDLTDFIADAHTRIEINTIFGSGLIKLKPEQPLKIVVNSAFAGAKMPDGNMISFGKYIYQTPGFKENQTFSEVAVNVVFGEVEFTERN